MVVRLNHPHQQNAYRVHFIHIHVTNDMFPLHPVSVKVITDAIKFMTGELILLPHLAVKL